MTGPLKARLLTFVGLLCACQAAGPSRPIEPVADAGLVPPRDTGADAPAAEGGSGAPDLAAPRADGALASDLPSSGVPDAAAPPSDAAPSSDLASTGGTCAGAQAITKVLTPKLFSQGADPSTDPECTAVLNPERGFFTFHDLRNLGPLGGLRGQGFTLIYGEALIPEYRNRDLDQPLLDRLSAAFGAIRAAGLKVLPRVYYADGMMADAPLERVLAHIQQLTPLLRANADVIAALHPGFVGAWGEWHASTNDLTAPAARKKIYDALLAALPADRMTLTRRPSFKQEAYGGPLTSATAFSGQPLARVGHLNDCFLGSADDVGTYQLPGEEAYAVADSAFVPVGGETCAPEPVRSACPSALTELARLHWSFLNSQYHEEVLAGWKKGGCYPTIQCRLGFRLVALSHQVPRAVKAGQTLSVALRLVNDGYGRVYNPRPVNLVLVGPQRHVLSVDADPRRWAPGEPVDLCLSARLPAGAAPGTYQVGLWMPDAADSLQKNPAYAVRLSNATWDATGGTSMLDAFVTVEN
jgi:hypothetical protein